MKINFGKLDTSIQQRPTKLLLHMVSEKKNKKKGTKITEQIFV